MPGGLLLYVSIFMMLLLIAADGKAVDPSADYPTRPIECVIPGPAGTTNDILGRMISDIIRREKILSQPLVILNKPGSGGAVAMGYTFERKSNPHVILTVASSSFICTPLIEKFPYNLSSFTFIANLVVDGSVLVVRSDSPFKTIDDLIAEARKRPNELIQGGGAFTSDASLMGRSMQKAKGVRWNHVSFIGGGTESIPNVLAGNVHFALPSPNLALDYVRAGKLRVLVVAAPKRFPEYKDAPTMEEAGMGESLLQYRGYVAPPNMPGYAVKKLEAALKKVMENDRFKKYMGDVMVQPFWLSPQEYGKLIEKETDKWRELLSELDLLKKK
jgi:tripartite-type tricarboxylate transporter receptor subunit TctC